MKRFSLSVLSALTLVGGLAGQPASARPVAAAKAAVGPGCDHEAFSIQYPAGWHTEERPLHGGFVVRGESDHDEIMLSVELTYTRRPPWAMDEIMVRGMATIMPEIKLVSREPVMVAGLSGTRLDFAGTHDGKEHRSSTVTINHEARQLHITFGGSPAAFERSEAELKAILDSIRIKPLTSQEAVRDHLRGADLADNGSRLFLALEDYELTSDRGCPPVALVLDQLRRARLIDPRALKPNTFGPAAQPQAVVGLEAARGLLAPAGKKRTPLGTVLGPGKEPGAGAPDALTYGVLVYDRDWVTNKYVLYGIGRRGDQAVVVFSLGGL